MPSSNQASPGSSGGLEASITTRAEVIEVAFAGTAEVPDRATLGEVLARVHSTAEQQRAQQVRVDFRQLRFMTSACFKDFVSWLSKVREMSADRRYRIHFLSNPNIRWQRASLAALGTFAIDVVTIE